MKSGEGHKTATWSELLPKLKNAIEESILIAPKRVVVVLSPFLTVEEAYALGAAFKKQSELVRLVLGPVPVIGEDDHYPKDVKGHAVSPAKFTIRAEKCPNRLGVEAVLKKLQGEVVPFSSILGEMSQIAALWFAGGYPNAEWVNAAVAAPHAVPSLVVVQDLFASKLTGVANFVLPATTAFEKDGTFVNHAGLAQPFFKAAKPTAETRSELQLAFDLWNRKGLATIAAIRKDVAKAMPAFALLAEVQPPKLGKRLELATI
jgi:NADH-quinone oxidoreductase subunit G